MSACKKRTTTQPCEQTGQPVAEETKTYPSYSRLKTGNYWVYERFQIEQHGSVSSLKQFDSSYVEKDTLIRNQTFFKVRRHDLIYNREYGVYLRDSLHYIIDSAGRIVFSSEDFTTVYDTYYVTLAADDTAAIRTRKMNDKDLVTITPAGTFTTSNMQTTHVYYPKYITVGINNPRYMNSRYAKNIGLVVETEPFYFMYPIITEKRLIRYHLN